MSRRRFSPEQWQGWVAEQAESGLSVTAFCLSREIPAQSFYAWRRKLANKTTSDSCPNSFVSVSVRGLGQIEIDLPCGAVIRVPPDESSIRRVIDALLRNGGDR
jgi:transposase-like protein